MVIQVDTEGGQLSLALVQKGMKAGAFGVEDIKGLFVWFTAMKQIDGKAPVVASQTDQTDQVDEQTAGD